MERIITTIGTVLFAIIGCSWPVDPRASSKFDKKYIIKMRIKEYVSVKVYLSFCFKFITREDANRLNAARYNGSKIKL